MKTINTTNEILLFANTSYARREFCFRDTENDRQHQAADQLEQLEKACWAGMLCELLPEIINKQGVGREQFIWNIMSGKNFLYITMGPLPGVVDTASTIDPYFCTTGVNEN